MIDKFLPQSGININNISLIKQDSLNSDRKFIGSLDLRDAFLK
jgi:hypothetical protein